MHSSWYSRRRIFKGGPIGFWAEDVVAYRRKTRDLEQRLHLWRFLTHPLEAGGIIMWVSALLKLGGWVFFDSSSLIRATVSEPADANPCPKLFGLSTETCLGLKVYFQYFCTELEVKSHTMWTARNDHAFHQTRLKCTQNRNHGP